MVAIKGNNFIDQYGRVLHLRGVNLGGSSKVPCMPDGATWNKQGFYQHRNVSFVGRPFPLEEADEHYSRLKSWGLTFLRFLITWEAIEHSGPGEYDQEYLEYLTRVVEKAAGHGLTMFIDPHQDVWSRFTGGDGAPGWIFEKLGMDLTKFHQAGAAFTHQECGDPYPRMIWSSNYSRYACATMWTLFFGGNTFAPETKIDGIPVQDYLQEHYINALRQAAERLKGFGHVVGFDTLNEPSVGYIGYPDLNRIAADLVAQGPSPTMYQGMLLAAGYPQEVSVKSQIPFAPARKKLINDEGISIWQPGVIPIWQQHGVWGLDETERPVLHRPDYFSAQNGKPVNFYSDHFLPFVEKFTQGIRAHKPEAIIFVSPPPGELASGEHPDFRMESENVVYAPHWYDGVTLALQRYIPWLGVNPQKGKIEYLFGRKRKRRSFVEQIADHISTAEKLLGKAPTLIGETGISYNLNAKRAYTTGDFSQQILAMDDTIQALEANLVNFTLWNYTADNTNLRGDLWNDEDLSIFSRDQMTGAGSLNDGGRALEAVVRPYAIKTPGHPVYMHFDLQTKGFVFKFELDTRITAPLEIFLPQFQYPEGVEIEAPAGKVEVLLTEQKLLYSPNTNHQHHTISILPKR